MDATLYDEFNNSSSNNRARAALETKSNLALDFADVALKRERFGGVGLPTHMSTSVGTCDLHELPSPELERFLLQPIEGGVDATGTPSGCVGGSVGTPTTQILFPKSVTEEQEAYARGFVDALEQLHKRQGAPNVPESESEFRNVEPIVVVPGSDGSVALRPEYVVGLDSTHRQPLPAYANFASTMRNGMVNEGYSATIHHMPNANRSDDAVASGLYPGTDQRFLPAHPQPQQQQPMFYSGSAMTLGSGIQEFANHFQPNSHQHPQHPNLLQHHQQPQQQQQQQQQQHLEMMGVHASTASSSREEPQTVPRLGDTPPLSPIDMDDQERIKLERKRARNRMAARKCRTRKLEQIALLEERVAELRGRNNVLACSASLLRDDVTGLERHLNEHVASVVCLLHHPTQAPNPAGHHHRPADVVSSGQYARAQ